MLASNGQETLNRSFGGKDIPAIQLAHMARIGLLILERMQTFSGLPEKGPLSVAALTSGNWCTTTTTDGNEWKNLHRTRQPARARTCAVVSNSAFLLNQQAGTHIDTHDHVYRIGYGPPGGIYAPYIGTRVTHRVTMRPVHPTRSVYHHPNPTTAFIYNHFAHGDRKNWKKQATESFAYGIGTHARDLAKRGPTNATDLRDKVLVMSYSWQHAIHNASHGRVSGVIPLSTGFWGLLAALSSCERVSLYCFDSWLFGSLDFFASTSPVHYYDNNRGLMNTPTRDRLLKANFDAMHPWWIERLIIQELTAKGVLRHYCKLPTPFLRDSAQSNIYTDAFLLDLLSFEVRT